MKILAIRLENLASLAGHHEIDFTASPLADQGLFAITGPTGAGKSTLLDALCLALYGSTPRLRQAPRRDSQIADVNADTLTTADARTLLRRGCSGGFAEVDFVGRDGRRYRARWSVRRARDKVDGSLQKAEQSLTDLDANQLLTAQTREFEKLLPERLGLKFDQFTRAVLLAQSEFAAFLKADDNERSELLERLTDTQHYSEISKAAYQRVRDAKAALEAIDARLADSLPVDAETRAELERQAQIEEQALAELQAELNRHQAQAVELERDAQLHQAWQQADAQWQRVEQAWQQSQPQRERLAQLDDLAPWRERAERRQALERSLTAHRQTLEDERRQLEACDTERRTLEPQLSAAREAREQARNAYQAAQPELEQARRLAADLEHQQQRLEQQQQEHRQLAETSKADDERHRQLVASRQPLEQRLQRQRATLVGLLGKREGVDSRQIAHDTRSALNDRRDQAQRDLQALQTLQQDWREGERLRQERSTTQHQLQSERQRLADLETQGKRAKVQLTAAEAEETAVRQQIEGASAARSDAVDRLRQQLSDDQPCPVCGGTDHPYRHSPPSRPDATLIEAIERQEQVQLADQRRKVENAHQVYHQCSADYRACRQGLQERESHLETVTRQLEHAEQVIDAHSAASALRQSGNAAHWLESRQQQFTRQWREASDQLSALDEAERALQPLEAEWQQLSLELGRLEERRSLSHERQQALETSLPALRQARDDISRQLSARLGHHASVSDWQATLEQHREHAEAALETCQTRWQNLTQTHTQSTQRVADLEQRQTEAQMEFEALDGAWQAWRAARPKLDDERIDSLLGVSADDHRQLRDALAQQERERNAASIKREERREALRDQRRRLLPAADTAQLLDETNTHALSVRLTTQRETAQALIRQRDERQETRDASQHRLREDDRRRLAQREGARARESAQREVDRWERLNGLIGSADGKRFRRIAQAYNLDHLLTHANQHLHALTPRYRLTRGGSELGILVIDGDMADERRSVHSLSGGETFLVSLALALGLASMASHQLAIESLFIDEGFGSLDPQSLALAMDALDGLQAQGRRVGVISHVQEMHERIPLQIRVEPSGNGASQLVIRRV
ncbi:AAA family ATPase [Salinicola corii]|uniref:Nuclease SbcCD subunit C n=1 Tax=Salinicola corii TaxID=2606937 RepID=A0A640WJ45_9GAMM|nr:AAA family ATPase [Salinicola corii]KAA0020676.1 AAA family ATPase [Salinicola corii]